MGMQISGMDEVIRLLDKLSKKTYVDEASRKAVDAAKDVVAGSMSSAIAASEGIRTAKVRPSRATGSVAGSVQPTKAKINSYGAYSVARPTGRDKNAIRNAEKAAILEYGSSTLAARPWRGKAVKDAEDTCVKIMEDVIVKEFDAQ